MKVLRAKGSSLPIKISIKINNKDKEPSIKYDFENQIHTFKEIKDFFVITKDNYISQLNDMYKKDLNIRFLLGKQFRNLMKI